MAEADLMDDFEVFWCVLGSRQDSLTEISLETPGSSIVTP